VNGQRVRSRLRWNLKGDRVTKEFFRGVREKAASSVITSLHDRDGNLVTKHIGLQMVCTDFYQALYTAKRSLPAHDAAMQALIDLIPKQFFVPAQERL
jgi:hypothetical protein